jgi:hypothetical protein
LARVKLAKNLIFGLLYRGVMNTGYLKLPVSTTLAKLDS